MEPKTRNSTFALDDFERDHMKHTRIKRALEPEIANVS
jgi:hypothetical protein